MITRSSFFLRNEPRGGKQPRRIKTYLFSLACTLNSSITFLNNVTVYKQCSLSFVINLKARKSDRGKMFKRKLAHISIFRDHSNLYFVNYEKNYNIYLTRKIQVRSYLSV